MIRKLVLLVILFYCLNQVKAISTCRDTLQAKALFDKALLMVESEQSNKSDSILLILNTSARCFGEYQNVKGVLRCMILKMQVYAQNRIQEKTNSLFDSIGMISKKFFGEQNIFIAKAYENLGLYYTKTDKFQQALECNLKAFDYFTLYDKMNYKELAFVYSNLGNNYSNLEDLKKALDYHLLSLETYQKNKKDDDTFISKLYFNIGNDYFDRSEFDLALQYYFKSQEVKKKLFGENSLSVAFEYDIIGNVYDSKNEYDKALEYCFKSLAIIKSILGEKDIEVAASYNSLAIIYGHLDKLNQSLDYYFKCLEIRKEILGSQNSLVASTFNNIAVCYYNKSEYDSSLYYFNKSLEIQKIILGENHTVVAMLYNNIGNVYIEKAEYEEALKYHNKSLQIRKSILGEKHIRVAYAYNSIGNIYNLKGELDKSLEYYFKALEIRIEKLGNKHNDVASSYLSIGSIFLYKEQYSKALEYFFKSLEIRKTIFGEKHSLIANIYANIGDAYKDLGEFEKALQYQNKCLEIRSEVLGPNHSTVAASFNKLGQIYEGFENYSLAVENYQKGIEVLKKNFGNKHVDVAISYNNLGNLYFKLRKYENALLCFQKALVANCRFFSDTINLETSPRAKDYLDPYSFMESLSQKARVEQVLSIWDNGKDSLISDYLKKVLLNYQICDSLIDQTRIKATLTSDKIALGEKASVIYGNAIDLCSKIYEKRGAFKMQAYEKAFYFSEKSKGITLLQSLAEVEGMNYSGIPDSLIKQEKRIKSDIAYFEKQLTETEDSLSELKLRGMLFKLNRNYDNLINFLEKNYPRYFNLKYSNKQIDIKEIQTLLDKGSAIYSYFLTDTCLYVFFIAPKTVGLSVVKGVSGLSDSIYTFRNAVLINNNFASHFNSSGRFLFNKLFPRDLIVPKKISNLIIIPDGALAFIPFESLPTQEFVENKRFTSTSTDSLRGFKNVSKSIAKYNFKDFPFLINRYNISYVYSATLYYQTFLDKNKNIKQKTSLLAIAPLFTDKEVEKATASTKELQQKLLVFKTDSVSTRGLLLDGDYVSPLPGSEFEVRSIQKEFSLKGLNAKTLISGEASEKLIKAGLIEGYSILHFATHGFVNSEKPELSGMLLAQDSSGGQDGILYSGEICNLNLNADLTVLSACETGLGKVRKGEGIIGLTRALLYAGSKNIIVSLWPVSDQSTSDLMIEFYKNLLNEKKNQSYSQWLRQAKLKMIKEGKYSNPFYWSPFILIGK